MGNSDRIDYIDTAKGMGILFVVIGHHLLGADVLRAWINSFHMPMFFMITGYLFSYKNETYKDIKQMIKEKARRILYPYFTFSILIFVWYMVYYIILRSEPDESLECVLTKIVTTYGYHALWFLPTLFFGTILFLFINKREKSNGLFFGLIILGSMLSIFINIPVIKEKFYWYVLNYFTRGIIATGFIYLGFKLECIDKKIHNKRIECLLIMLSLIISVILLRFNFDKANLALSRMGNPFLYYVLAISGSAFIILLCKQLNMRKGVFNFWGRNSLIIMAIHMDLPVEIAWIIVGVSGLSTTLPQLGAASIVVIIELIIESTCVILINKYFRFMIVDNCYNLNKLR